MEPVAVGHGLEDSLGGLGVAPLYTNIIYYVNSIPRVPSGADFSVFCSQGRIFKAISDITMHREPFLGGLKPFCG